MKRRLVWLLCSSAVLFSWRQAVLEKISHDAIFDSSCPPSGMDTGGRFIKWKTAPLTEGTVRRGDQRAGSAAYRYSYIIYRNKVDYTGDVDLRGGGGTITYVAFTVSGRDEVVINGEQNGRRSKSGLPVRPWDEKWNRVWRHWRRRGKRRQS